MRSGGFCLLVALAAACGPLSDPCFDDRGCEQGERCVGAELTVAGACEACDATETPYDGIDNDCSLRTPDTDLDGDGDNALSSPVAPGGDCDDMDPTIFSGAFEACGDGIDSDCDGEGVVGAKDDDECGDRDPPMIEVLEFPEGTLRGEVSFRVRLTDDAGVKLLTIGSRDLPMTDYPYDPALRTREVIDRFDTRKVGDDLTELIFEATDVADRMAQVSLSVRIQNGPELDIQQPLEGAAYMGWVPVVVLASDPDGVDRSSFRAWIDGAVVPAVDTSTAGGAFRWLLDLSSVPEGPKTVVVSVADNDEAKNKTETTIDIRLDRTPPELTLLQPVAGSTVSETITVEWGVDSLVGNPRIESLNPTDNSTAGASFSLDTTRFLNGPLMLEATAADDARGPDGQIVGNRQTATARIFTENTNTGPIITILQPSSGATVLGPTEVELAVDGGAMNRVEVAYDGVVVANLEAPPWQAVVDLQAAPGVRELRATVTDSRAVTRSATATVTQVATAGLRMALESRPTASAISDLQVGDFDGDQVLDYMTAAGSYLELHAGRLVNGRYFNEAPRRLAAVRLDAFALVDIDGDGDLDVVGTNAMELITLTQGPSGQLGPQSSMPLPTTGMGLIAAADIDGDGDADVALAGASGAAGLLYRLNAGAYSYDRPLGGDGGISEIRFADADMDSDIDLVAGREGARTVSVYLNDGTGTFGVGIDSQPDSPAASVAVGDVSGDGFPDLVAGTANGVEIMLGSESSLGSFGAPVKGAGKGEDGVAVVDVDADGNFEVLAVDAAAEALSLWELSEEIASEREAWLVGQEPRLLRVADLDGNSRPDLLVVKGRHVVRVAIDGDGSARAPRVVRTGAALAALDVGQIVGGAELDLAAVDATDGALKVLQGDGQLGFRQVASIVPPPMSTGFEAVRIGDVDGMGGADLAVILDAGTGAFSRGVLLGDGNGMFTENYFAGSAPVDVVISDIDADGQSELGFVRSSPSTVDNGLDITTGSGTLEESVLGRGEGAVNAFVGRFAAGASAQQIGVANGQSDNITVYRLGATRYEGTNYTAIQELSRASVGRVGTDAVDDIVGVSDDAVFYLESDSSTGFRTAQTYEIESGLVDVKTLDVNCDGLPDLVIMSDDGALFVLVDGGRPTGRRRFFGPVSFGYAQGGNQLFVADIDGDGQAELLSNHAGSGTLVVVAVDGCPI
ncbi:MAG: FG-GAP-like repeat-containing protein [Myxococcota bacterium]